MSDFIQDLIKLDINQNSLKGLNDSKCKLYRVNTPAIVEKVNVNLEKKNLYLSYHFDDDSMEMGEDENVEKDDNQMDLPF